MAAHRPKPWYRPRNLILLAVALLVTALGRQIYLALTARPGQAIDYPQKLQELIEASQPADGGPGTPDAWPVLVDAIARTTQATERIWPVSTRQNSTTLDYSAIYSVAETPKYDDAHTWEEVRAFSRQGLEALRDEGVFARLDEVARMRRAVRPIPKGGHLLDILLPELGQSRNLARANAARMHLARESGDDKELLAAYEQMLALARINNHQALLIEHLVGYAIAALADNRIREMLTERPFSEQTCRDLLAAMDRQLPLPPITLAMNGERLGTLDAIQWTHTDDGRGSGRLIVSAWQQLGGGGAAAFGSGGLMGQLSSWKILNLGGLVFPSKAANIRKANEFYDLLNQYASLSYAQRQTAPNNPDRLVQSLPVRYVVLRLMLPALAKAIDTRTQYEMTCNATRIMLALEIYNAQNGRYPESLDQLVPSILPSLPAESYSGHWGYRLLKPEEDTIRRADDTPRPYLLYSFGADGKDNNGKVHSKEPYTALRMPAGAGCDWVANQPRRKPAASPEPVPPADPSVIPTDGSTPAGN